MIKFILVLGMMTPGGFEPEFPEQRSFDTMEECYDAGVAHFADRDQAGAYIMCGSTTVFQDIEEK